MPTIKVSDHRIVESQTPKILPAGKSPLYYGFGVLGFNLFMETFNGYAYYYYLEILGFAMTMAALVRLITTIWDAMNDPIFGYLSDNTRSRHGRRYAWLLPSSLVMGIIFVLIFSAPGFVLEKTRLFWYMLFVLLVYETLITILTVNYLALFPEYFPPGTQRSRAAVYFQAAKNVAVLLGLACAPLLYKAVGFTMMAIIYSALGVALLIISIHGNHENPDIQMADRVSVYAAFKNVLKEPPFWLYGMTITLASFAVNMVPFSIPFYVTYVLKKDATATSLLLGIALITSILILPVWGKIAPKWQMRNTFTITLLVMSIGTILLYLSENAIISIAGMTVFGIGWGGVSVCNHIIRANLITYNLTETGKNTEGLYYGLLNVIQRLGGLFQSMAMYLAATYFGYISGSEPGPQPDMAFRFLIGLVPFIGLCISFLLSRLFFKYIKTTQTT